MVKYEYKNHQLYYSVCIFETFFSFSGKIRFFIIFAFSLFPICFLYSFFPSVLQVKLTASSRAWGIDFLQNVDFLMLYMGWEFMQFLVNISPHIAASHLNHLYTNRTIFKNLIMAGLLLSTLNVEAYTLDSLMLFLLCITYYLHLVIQILNSNPHYYTNVSYVTDISS